MTEKPEQQTRQLLKIGITMGDVNGIGPEILLKAFEDSRILNLFTPVIYGSGKAVYFYKNHLNLKHFNYKQIQEANQAVPGKINFIECSPGFERVKIGFPAVESGMAAFQALEKATLELKEGKIAALVTLPINKKTIQHEQFSFPGHTEYLASTLGVKENLMMMVYENLRVAVVTGHIPVSEISKNLSVNKIYSKIKLMNDSLRMDFSIEKPKIAVLGLNPHAGDSGLLGTEEQDIIAKAIEKAQDEKMLVWGSFPADGFFAQAQWQNFDGVLAMYHDQGLIPFKTIARGYGVNFTAGMPFVRTSPDHGTAFDISGKNIAKTDSFFEALYLAIDIAKRKTENTALIANKLHAIIPKEALQEDEVIN